MINKISRAVLIVTTKSPWSHLESSFPCLCSVCVPSGVCLWSQGLSYGYLRSFGLGPDNSWNCFVRWVDSFQCVRYFSFCLFLSCFRGNWWFCHLRVTPRSSCLGGAGGGVSGHKGCDGAYQGACVLDNRRILIISSTSRICCLFFIWHVGSICITQHAGSQFGVPFCEILVAKWTPGNHRNRSGLWQTFLSVSLFVCLSPLY